MLILKRSMMVAALAASMGVAACSDSTSPDSVDPLVLSSDMANAAGIFDNNAAFQSMRTLSAKFPRYAATALLRASPPAALPSAGPVQARLPARLLADLRGARDIQALFPANVLGKTLIWDVATSQYVVGTQTGAPSNGIRILIYVVNPATDEPVVPLQQLGYLDLTDKSTAQFDRLGVLLRLLGNTIANYDVTLTAGTASVQLRAAGRLYSVDLARFLDFDLVTSVDLGLQVTIMQDVTGSDGTVLHLEIAGTDSTGTLLFRVGKGRNSIQISGTTTSTAVDAQIRFNGTVVATITGDPDAPVIAGANGRQLSPQQIQALVRIFETAFEFLGDLTEGVYGPAGIVF